jgi:hypothetical protein
VEFYKQSIGSLSGLIDATTPWFAFSLHLQREEVRHAGETGIHLGLRTRLEI